MKATGDELRDVAKLLSLLHGRRSERAMSEIDRLQARIADRLRKAEAARLAALQKAKAVCAGARVFVFVFVCVFGCGSGCVLHVRVCVCVCLGACACVCV